MGIYYNIASRCPVLRCRTIYLSVYLSQHLSYRPLSHPLPRFAVYMILEWSWIMTRFRCFSGAPLSRGVCGRAINVRLLWRRGLLKWQGAVIPSSHHSHQSHRRKKKGRKQWIDFWEVLHKPSLLIPPASAKQGIFTCGSVLSFRASC